MAFWTGGRGRGRAKNLAAAISKPGGDSLSNKYSSLNSNPAPANNFSALNEVEKSLVLCLKTPSKVNLDALQNHAETYSENTEAITKIVDLLCTKCLGDSDLATASGEVASSLVRLENIGVTFRSMLLKKVQEFFKKREEMSKDDFSSYLGFITLLSSLFKSLRVNDEPLKPLTVPVYKVLEELLDGRSNGASQREEEIETFHSCLVMSGSILQNCDKTRMDELFKKVRQTILKKASPKMRCLLLEILEYHASGTWIINNETKAYYSDLLSDIMATG